MTSIEHLDETDPGALFHLYPGQQAPQDAYIALSIEDEAMWMESNGEIGNAVPSDVWHGTTLRFGLPPIQAAAANALLDELLPLAERVIAGASEQWDGSNNVGVYDADAQDAIQAMERLVNDTPHEQDGFDWMESEDWFEWDQDYVPGLIRDGLSRQAICERVESDLPTAPMMILPDLVEYVEGLVEAAEAADQRKVALASIVQAHVQTRELYTRIAEATEGVRQLDGQIYDALYALLASVEEIADDLSGFAKDIQDLEEEV